jgi:hypothetical protein
MLHSVAAQLRGFPFKVGRDDEHARQVGIGTSFRSLLGMDWSAYVGADGHGGKIITKSDEGIAVAWLKYRGFWERHSSAVATIATCVRREGPEVVLCVKPGRANRIEDEGTDA